MDFSTSKLGRLFDELLDAFILEEITGYRKGFASSGIDLVGYLFGLGSINI